MDYNSIRNQDIKGQFVQKHIYACMTCIVEYVLAKSNEDRDAPFSYDDLPDSTYFEDALGNSYSYQEREDQLSCWQDELDAIDSLLEHDDQNASYIQQKESLEVQIDDLNSAAEQFAEIYEWWICSSWLASRLRQFDQVILEDGNNAYWGRCTTGQAILLDSVISRICEDMEILDGQRNMWK